MTMTRTAVTQETRRRMRRTDLQIGEDLRRIRIEASLSLRQLAIVVGIHKSYLARIETGQARPSLDVLTAIGVALGADLNIRYFPGAGPRLHDRFQAAMTETLLRSLDPRWRASVEVPVSDPARGVIDIVLADRASQVTIAVEVYSELRRLEQQVRWSAEKADGLARRIAVDAPGSPSRTVSCLLVLRSTVATREIARTFEATLVTAYPARAHDVFIALTSGHASWPGSGIVWMHQHGSETTLMPFPPPRVLLGR